MDQTWLQPTQLFDGETLHTGMAACVENGVVARIAAVPSGAVVTPLNGTLCPGFFDIQINGGGGVLFNTDPTPAGLEAIARAHHPFGTRRWLPTVITDAPAVMERAVSAVLATHGRFGIAGIHIEGPHISLPRRGTHKPAYIRPLDAHTLTQIDRLRAANVPTLLTLAPEAVQPGEVAALVARGVVVSIGHTDATAAETRALLAEGAMLFTHLFNAMSQMENREPNVVGAAINSDAYCSMIADGVHVDPSMLAMACRARPVANRMILVTDAMPTVGGPDSFRLYGQDVRLEAGRLINAEGSLAGAHTTLPEGLAILLAEGVSLQAALRMVTRNPARLMGLAIGQLIGAPVSDLVVLDAGLGPHAVVG